MATDSQLAAFIARQRLLLTKEREAEIERSSLLLSNCGHKLLEQKGLSLGGLGIASVNVGLGGKTLVELERPAPYHSSVLFPPHSFRPGDLARVESNASVSGPSKKVKKNAVGREVEAKGVVYKVSDTRITIAIDPPDSGADDHSLPEHCRVIKLANSITYDRMDNALNQLERMVGGPRAEGKSNPELPQLIKVVLGLTMPSPPAHIQELHFFDETLNASQKEAVRFCLVSPEIACIHGPPGTGKTHTLIEIIRQLVTVSLTNLKPQRLLVCGASNLSVDNILERLLALPPGDNGKKIKVTRIGHPARVMARAAVLYSTLDAQATRTDQAALVKDVKAELEAILGTLTGKGTKGKSPRGAERRKLWEEVKALRKEYRRREGGIVKSVLSEAQIVLATCHSSGGNQLRNHDFDVLIIDEATQALEAACWISIFKAKKLILAGDPMQLPPTVLSVASNKKQKRDLAPTPKTALKPKTGSKLQGDINPQTVHPDNESDVESISGSTDHNQVETPSVVTNATARSSSKTRTPGNTTRPLLRPPCTLETTLFDRLERMYGPGIKRMLEVQYRMHAKICAFPSQTLYASKLHSHQSVAARLLRDLPTTHAESDEDDRDAVTAPVVFFDTAGCEYFERLDGDGDEGSRSNENEALVVKSWVEKLAEVGVQPEQIAVITPYQAQVTLLTSLLRPVYGSGLEIGTVDGMQGREKEAVIISLVRSNANREVGFLKEKRRLNVAMTRAKMHLCVVGDSSTVSHGGSYLKKWLAWLEANADVRYAGLE